MVTSSNHRLAPLPPSDEPRLQQIFAQSQRSLGFVSNSLLIMQRRPELALAFAGLTSALWGPSSQVENGLKRLIAFVASRAAGCQYCMAHTAEGALHLGVPEDKFMDIWAYETSPHFSDGERAALDVAISAASVPNNVTDEMFARLKMHWTDPQIVEIVATISIFGFLNRWNDTLATPLEDQPLESGQRLLTERGWSPGKHI